MSFARLEEIAKENALECKHIGHRLYMSATLSGRLMQRYKPDLGEQELTKLRDTVFGAPLLYELMGVPIVNDIGITDPTLWLLLDPTGEEVERGNVEPEHDEARCSAEYKNCQCLCPTCMTHTRKITPHADAPESATERKASGAQTE